MQRFESLLSLVWMLLCVLLIVALAYLFTRYVAGRGGFGALGLGSGSEQFKVLTRLPLGREQSAVLIQAGERYLLLGVTQAQISLLAELSSQEAQNLQTPPSGQTPPSFGEALRTVLQQKKQR